MSIRYGLAVVACALALPCAATATPAADEAGAPARLALRYAALKESLRDNALRRPLHMDSTQGADSASGEIYALVDSPFAIAGAALASAPQWCDIMMLHLNTKACALAPEGARTTLHVMIGRKYDQPAADAYPVDFAFRVVAATVNYLQVRLTAAEGPIGTRDYLILLEAVPADGARTFIRLSYSYGYGFAGRMAMMAYLGTVGRDKVGFSVVGKEPGGQPRYVGGVRGIVERNTMRYYLAIESYLGALAVAPAARLEKGLGDWFTAIEGYPRQLHEMERGEYLDMKRNEAARARVKAMLLTTP